VIFIAIDLLFRNIPIDLWVQRAILKYTNRLADHNYDLPHNPFSSAARQTCSFGVFCFGVGLYWFNAMGMSHFRRVSCISYFSIFVPIITMEVVQLIMFLYNHCNYSVLQCCTMVAQWLYNVVQ